MLKLRTETENIVIYFEVTECSNLQALLKYIGVINAANYQPTCIHESH